jgi:hypothetical protein
MRHGLSFRAGQPCVSSPHPLAKRIIEVAPRDGIAAEKLRDDAIARIKPALARSIETNARAGRDALPGNQADAQACRAVVEAVPTCRIAVQNRSAAILPSAGIPTPAIGVFLTGASEHAESCAYAHDS